MSRSEEQTKEEAKKMETDEGNKKRKASEEELTKSKKRKKEIAKTVNNIPLTGDVLPTEIIKKFFDRLARPSLAVVSRVSNRWHDIAQPIIEDLKKVDELGALLIKGNFSDAIKYLSENKFDASLFVRPLQIIEKYNLSDNEITLTADNSIGDEDWSYEQNLLHVLAYSHPPDDHKELYLAVIDALIARGVGVNSINAHKYSVLMTAIEEENNLLFDKLLTLPQIDVNYCIPGQVEDHCAVLLAAAKYEDKPLFLKNLLEKNPVITQEMVDQVTEQSWQEAGFLINPYVFDRFGELDVENTGFKQKIKTLETQNEQLKGKLVDANEKLAEAKKHIEDLTEQLRITKDHIEKIETDTADADADETITPTM